MLKVDDCCRCVFLLSCVLRYVCVFFVFDVDGFGGAGRPVVLAIVLLTLLIVVVAAAARILLLHPPPTINSVVSLLLCLL